MPPRQKTAYRVSPSVSVTAMDVGNIVLNEISHRDDNTTYFYPNKHPVIYFILKGRCSITANKTTNHCLSGTAIIINDNKTLPVEFSHSGTKIFSFPLTPALCQQLNISLPDFTTHAFSNYSFVNNLLTRLFHEFSKNDDHASECILSILSLILIELKREAATSYVRKPPWVNKLATLLNNNLSKPIDLRWVASQLKRNYNHLSRAIPIYFHCTFHELLLSLRLKKAATLLLETNQPIYAIAADCGFASTSHFDNHFRHAYGLTPLQFRSQS